MSWWRSTKIRSRHLFRSVRFANLNSHKKDCMIQARNLGFPRIGARRELKFALESYWSGQSGAVHLERTAWELRKRHWQVQIEAGIRVPPSNDFSLYDHVLDTAAMVGAVPGRYGWCGPHVDLPLSQLLRKTTALIQDFRT